MVDHVKLKHRLALRLARYTVVLAFLIGLLLSSLQVIGDYQNQESLIDETIQQILVVSRPPATRAVNTLDTTLAEEVVNGLLQYPFVASARIQDELDKDLAYLEINHQHSSTRWITDRITSGSKTYQMALRTPDYVGVGPGHMVLVVNMDEALRPFFARSVIVILSGVARNVLLAVLLMILFYLALTRPLEQLAAQFLAVKGKPEAQHQLSVPESHANNELGMLCDAGNEFIATVQQLLKAQAQSAEALKISEIRLHRLIDQIPQLVVAQNASGDILFSNQQFANFYGQSLKAIRDFKLKGLTSRALEIAHLDSIREKTLKSKAVTYINQLALTNHKGQQQVFSVQVAPFEYFTEPATLLVANDISKLLEAQAHIAHLANHDSLTGLANRVLLSERINQALVTSRNKQEFSALLFMDLDHFKTINDTQGHGVGDEVLKLIAQRLQEVIGHSDTVARLGGDEFIILMRQLDKQPEQARQQVTQACDRLLSALAEPFHVAERTLFTGASIGIVMFPAETRSKDDLLRYADMAMYRAKAKGRNQAVFFDPRMKDEIEQRHQLESQLHRALELQQFVMHYQGCFAADGQLVGVEALLRWHNPQQGLLTASQFMPALESGALVLPVAQWLLQQCCQQLAQWRASGFWQSHWQLSINISAWQLFREDFVAEFEALLKRYQLDAGQLCIELGEAIAVESVALAIERSNSLRALGVQIALDDFGTGYSSLRYLQDLPLDILKIDDSLIAQLPHSDKAHTMMSSIAVLAKVNQLTMTAEGVENEQQFKLAGDCGCVRFQGRYFADPVAAQELSEQLSSIIS